ncbi:rim15, signal transduction response regulator [Elasticomyces elasticus]|uniref:non-specific serine/threonine protein kinase n=1 Tax=Exophiala sideris TaxID=1016849 RepID=A0ABR0JA96_9EURO|nr:rim15, signal transduction response regulator [Elasticomyces elasticus]KAK5026110.1 rim15, signal transduction response regulator [Exophiala sideris]KAK5032364.1 rim15, signal transduction response regulator [Exophiala sideris]KAK5059520.1 rim15, signal transduction response regulator [Exophiala sideris]KAK5186682.1 rim15, signal transduction response regulator [Eurotiomycetes sp. CCFEE 6388]
MAEDGSAQQFLKPPAIAAIKSAAGFGSDLTRHAMERSFSQDIQEGTQDLKEAAEQTRNIILDLSLDGHIRWVSPSWTDVVGTELDAVRGRKISEFVSDDPNVFETAIEALRSNDSKSRLVRFAVKIPTSSDMAPMLLTEDGAEANDDNVEIDESGRATLELEGQGIMVYDRASGDESHTMWMLQPAQEPLRIEIALPRALVEVLGVGAEILAKYLTELAEAGANDPENHPPPLPILCRVCERSIVPWWFEKHSDLCVQEHKAEMDVQMIQDTLTDHRNAIVKVLDAFEARQGRKSADNSPAQLPGPEYKGLPIGPSPIQSSAVSSAAGSHAASPVRSISPSAAGLGHARARSFVVRRPLVRIVELILDLCDTAIEINVPSVKDSRSNNEDEYRSQSPQSESRITQVFKWQTPSSLENEPGLAALSVDTENLARQKVDAVRRHQAVLEYSERIRQEYMAEVDACIREALIKAERAAAGESLSSSESEAEDDSALEGILESPGEDEDATPMPTEAENSRTMGYAAVRSMASALRNPRDMPQIAMTEQRRSSSQAVSTGSSSPIECPTPRSHKSTLISQPQPVSNRRSMYIDDGNDSDSSLPSSSIVSNTWRTESPASVSDNGRSATSRDRKRRSMHIHGLNSASPHRQQSPGRYPPPPSSPLRMTKSRIPSGEIAAQSPIVSPLLTAGEYMPSTGGPILHRRQSSMHSSDKAPSSPRLNSINHPQQRAQPPSIKDFEVVKPISKGAFGSVYLAKKKSTGEYFAIKVLRKSDMVAKNQVTNVKAERAIMMWQGESDFVAKLYWTFSSKDFLYLVMEYLNGGDCASLIKILGGLSEDWAKKYIAEVVLGVEHLHSRSIVHRDLKPDNLLIDHKGHLKLTDFGLSRMGLIGRQKRALKAPEEPAPDLLKQGPFTQSGAGSGSNTASRSASFDYQGPHSPASTPLMTPALAGGLDQPSYFSLNRESSLSREVSFSRSGTRSDSGSGSSFDLHHIFKKLGVQEGSDAPPQLIPRGPTPAEEESFSQGSASPDLFPLSQSMSNISQPPPPASSQVLPPLFDPDESGRRFVGTPDYLAPETIKGTTQDEMCDWWSLGCILFEFLYGVPPFNAETTEQVFDNILNRRIAWPDDEDFEVSPEAKDLINKLIQLDPNERLGANKDEKYPSGGAEIQAHPWFADINWDTLLEDEAQFVPNPEHPEDTEYFDARGATLSSFPEELEDQLSPPGTTPPTGEYPNRPHDALFRARSQASSAKRGLMPLHIPPHVARDTRSRRLSEPVIADDFGNFTFKNLPVLEKANKDIVEKMRKEAMQAQSRGYSNHSQAVSAVNSPAIGSPAPSLEGSPMMPMPVKRALSISKGHRPGSPSGLGAQHHERRKTSGSSQGSSSLNPGSFFEIPHDAIRHGPPVASSPIKSSRALAVSPAKAMNSHQRQSSVQGRSRSQTVGSQDSDGQPAREAFIPGHYKRKSQLFVRDISPSSSDNEAAQAKALLKVQRRRQSSRRMSQINILDGPVYRPLDILICEDHPVSRMVMERLFEKVRCRAVTAANGPDALRLAVSQIQFDIIFMEFKLPLINGVDVARMIRDTKSANTQTPIVCITGYLKDLPEVHHFDTLMQKPPTLQKLSEMLCKYCSWKPPPRDFKLAAPLIIPPITSRTDPAQTQDSPSSVASSLAPTMPESSYKGSSREDSIGSGGFFSDLEPLKNDDIPVIVSRAATDDWARGGLGISDDIVIGQKPYVQSGFPHLVHTESAPPTAMTEEPPGYGLRTPRRQKSSEAVKSKRDRLEKSMQDPAGAAEEGDDEDEELGDVQARARSPLGKTARPTSKLGIEMMRTNSRGSVISISEDKAAEADTLRKSLEILEERLENLQIPEEPSTMEVIASQPRKKLDRTFSQHSHPEQETERRVSQGHITPPVIFPQMPGTTVAEIAVVDADATPVAIKVVDLEQEVTPKPQGSPYGPQANESRP